MSLSETHTEQKYIARRISHLNRERLKHERFWSAFIFIFLVLVITVARFQRFTFLVNRLFAPAMAMWIVYRFRERLFSLPGELYLYFLFLMWSFSGFFIAVNIPFFINYFKLMAQIFVLMVCITLYILEFCRISPVIAAFIVNGVVMFINVVATGELERAERTFVGDTRVAGLLQNANGFAYVLLLAGSAALFNWHTWRKPWQRMVIIGVVLSMSFGIVWSASRKAFLGWILFLAFWTTINFGMNLLKSLTAIFAIAVIGWGLWLGFMYVMEKSFLGERLRQMQRAESVLGSRRTELYDEAYNILKKHPVFGVGLSNFEVFSELNSYTHSDYMEVLTNTGIPGFLVYISIYILLLIRLVKLNFSRLKVVKWLARSMILFLAVYLMMAIGRPNFNDLFSMAFISLMAGFSHALQHHLSKMKIAVRMQAANR